MKKMNFLAGKARHDKPPLVLSIFLTVIFISSPLSGLLNPARVLNITERHFHDNPQGFFTFFMLCPDKNSPDDSSIQNNGTINEKKELTIDTTPKTMSGKMDMNFVIW
jgi:hypothetical protein